MTIELSQRFYFDAAHTLRRQVEAEGSRRIHGHTYHAEITLRSEPHPETGMLMDLGLVRQAMAEVRDQLDHHFLDEVPGIGPATLENLAQYIYRRLKGSLPQLCRVSVERPHSGDKCVYWPD